MVRRLAFQALPSPQCHGLVWVSWGVGGWRPLELQLEGEVLLGGAARNHGECRDLTQALCKP